MEHATSLISTLAAGFAYALLFGALAVRIGLTPIVGYLLAGVVVGPFTPGFVADTTLAPQLSEIGVIFLMFGVGIHFSLNDLASVWRIAVPGALAQIAAATAMGAALSHAWGWDWQAGLVFGLALSVASTVVLLRALDAVGATGSHDGRIAIGWLIVEDIVMVLALGMLPALAMSRGDDAATVAGAGPGAGSTMGAALLLALAKVCGFALLMLLVGRRVVPAVLAMVERLGSRELFVLAGLATALGIAYGAAALFGVSFALGAFLAGMVLNGSQHGHRVAEELLPMREAFAVLFFVSVGMAFDPAILVQQPLALLATVGVIVIGKSLAAGLIVLALRHPAGTAWRVATALAQVGEFSFILGAMGVALGLLPPQGQSLILGGALVSILLNPFLLRLAESRRPLSERR